MIRSLTTLLVRSRTIKKEQINVLLNTTKHKKILSQISIHNLHTKNEREPANVPRLMVNPQEFLYSEMPTIRLEGLQPLQPVTLKAEMVEDRGKLLQAHGHFVADSDGVVDVTQSPSLGGSYKGVFPSGLFSSLKVSSGHFEYGRIIKHDNHVPIDMTISALEGHRPIDEKEPNIGSIEVSRHIVGPGVQRIPVRHGQIRGILYLPEGEGPFPGVIDMFGATGHLQDTRAALNASRGLASLALAYFNYEDIPPERILNEELDYFEEAIEYLTSHPKVIPGKCGIIGNCFGGYLGFMTALQFSKVKAAFIINAPIVCTMETLKYKGKILQKGQKLPVDALQVDEDGCYVPVQKVNEALGNIDSFLVDSCHKAMNNGTHFAITIGDADTWEFKNGWDRLREKLIIDQPEKFTYKIYHDAGHLIPPPYTPFASIVYGRVWSDGYPDGILMKYGGDLVETTKMQEDTWTWMLNFINTHVGSAH